MKSWRDLRVDPLAQTQLSRVQAAALVAEGRLSREDADRLSGGGRADIGASGGLRPTGTEAG
jgi:hypothetical protein